MTTPEPGPRSTDLLASGATVPTTTLSWAEARAVVAESRFFWLATVHPTGRPHVRPVLAVWVGERLCTTTGRMAQKGLDLERDPRCSVTVRTDRMDVVLEGVAAPVTDPVEVERVAEAYRFKYGWPVTIVDGGFDAPYGAPTAGPPPYRPYGITPTVVFGFGTDDETAPRSTRWRF